MPSRAPTSAADGDASALTALHDAVALRERAIARVREAGGLAPPAAADAPRLLHELQLQQVELELQNEALRQARAALETSLARYTELYDRAPVGYLTLTGDGRIEQINRAGAALLEAPGEALAGQALSQYVERLDRPALRALLQRIQAGTPGDGCELSLRGAGGALRVVRVEAEAGRGAGCRITLADVTESRLSTDALRRSETKLRQAYRRLAQAQESERLRLTEQLHDQVGRNLTALGLNLSMLRQELAPSAGAETRARLQDSLALLQATVSQIRGLMSELYPPMLGDYGLYAALRWWAGEVGKRAAIEVVMLEPDGGLRLSSELETALFRIAQEALENAARHAAASRIEITLRIFEQRLELAVRDDGHGFDAEAVLADDERASWGLTWMRERALAIGARLQIESAPGFGTRVVVELPRGAW
jgi:signal transduction histidine kinase